MSSLFGIMSLAVRALLAEQGAMNATANNVANLNTPGFSRRRPVLVEDDPIRLGTLTLGSGVVLERLESLRDPILELRLHEETQQGGHLDALVAAMRQVEVMFSSSSGDIGTQLSNFFSSLQQLSTDPANISLRQGVLTAAGNLAAAFHTAANNLALQRANLDLDVKQAVEQINLLTRQIAEVNGQISAVENLKQDASAFVDQRTVLIRQLSALVDVSVIQTESSVTLTTSKGAALVAGDRSFDLTAQLDASGVQHVFAQGADITAKLTAGKIAGLLQVRDQKIPGLLASLDALAAGLANALNAAHRSGFDLNGQAGGDLFVPPAGSGQGAAGGLTVAITDPALLAASSDGSPGSNGNLTLLSAVHDQAIVSGQTPTDYYANLVFGIGSDVSNGEAELEASQLILRQLEDQRGSISGVSLDEEAANMLRYQRAFETAARVVNTVNELLDTTINLGRF